MACISLHAAKMQRTNAISINTHYCHLSVITEIGHKSTDEIQVSPECEDRGCYKHRLQYFLQMHKIRKVIEHSDRCQQFIKVTNVYVWPGNIRTALSQACKVKKMYDSK